MIGSGRAELLLGMPPQIGARICNGWHVYVKRRLIFDGNELREDIKSIAMRLLESDRGRVVRATCHSILKDATHYTMQIGDRQRFHQHF
jgi:hypothetical protein